MVYREVFLADSNTQNRFDLIDAEQRRLDGRLGATAGGFLRAAGALLAAASSLNIAARFKTNKCLLGILQERV